MIHIAARRLNNKEDAIDIVHDVFYLLWIKQYDKQITEHPNIGGWLIKTLNLLIYNQNRKLSLHALPLDSIIDNITVASEPKAYLEHSLPAEISDEDKALFIFYYDKGLGYSEIAQELNITPTTCRKKMSRAKKRYKALIEQLDV